MFLTEVWSKIVPYTGAKQTPVQPGKRLKQEQLWNRLDEPLQTAAKPPAHRA